MNISNWCRGTGMRLSHCVGGRITPVVVDKQTAAAGRRVGLRGGTSGLLFLE